MQSVPAMAFGFPMLLLAGYAAGGMTASLITLAALVGLFALMNVIVFVKFKRKNVKGGGSGLSADGNVDGEAALPAESES